MAQTMNDILTTVLVEKLRYSTSAHPHGQTSACMGMVASARREEGFPLVDISCFEFATISGRLDSTSVEIRFLLLDVLTLPQNRPACAE